MTKAELITKTIDRITDPWNDCPEDYIYVDPINLETAEEIICQCREEDVDFDQDDRLPAEVTPEIMMEAFNCNLRKNLYEYKMKQKETEEKQTMKTAIQIEFLEVDPGREYIVDVPEESTAEDLAYIIRNELHKGGTVMTNIYIDHIISREGK